jgi:hypothetical protein
MSLKKSLFSKMSGLLCFSPLATYALRFTVRKVRVDEISEKQKEVNKLSHVPQILHDLILQNRDSNRPLFAIRLRDVNPLNRLRPVRPSLQSLRKILKVLLEFLPIVTPHFSAYSRSCFPFEPKVVFPQTFHRIDMVKERREHLLPILLCSK